jgi:hypothetical protein
MERESVNPLKNFKVYCVVLAKTVLGSGGISFQPLKSAFVLCVFFLFSFQGFSQQKFEKESRIKAEDVPPGALSFVDSLTFDSRIKWYKETGLDYITIEAKAKINNERHSIEFGENGIFQDVEIEVMPDKIPETANSKITEILSQRHKKYKVEKVQIQYTGDRNTVLGFLRNNRMNPEGITINYEVVISTKMDGNYLTLEYLFSESGEYEQSSQIISRRKDTIDF